MAIFLFLVAIFWLSSADVLQAATVEYNLRIEKGMVDFSGQKHPAMTINGGIPGPVLRFREGDLAVIHVENRMDVETSIHWHGILLPNDQDGVPYLTYPPIAPGSTFTYRFPIKHAGTYWYHSHSGLQEQQGMYGSIAIEAEHDGYAGIRDEVVLFSDWSKENPHEIMRTLKRGSEWYAVRKGSAQNVLEAAQANALGNFFLRELARMPPMDIADVAYDRFLVNGQSESSIKAQPGEQLRLRLIDGAATTYFFIEYAGGPMRIIASDGVEVQPFEEDRFLIAVAETYDVLVTVPQDGSYELRATAHDGSGHTSVWIGQGRKHPARDVPKPNLYASMGGINWQALTALTPAGSMGMSDFEVDTGRFDQPGMNMGAMNHGHSAEKTSQMGSHAHAHVMKMSTGDGMMQETEAGSKMPGKLSETAIDGIDPRRPWPVYAKLRALHPTTFAAGKPRRDIRLTLDGDMERYVWLFNQKALHEDDKIVVRKDEVVRFILINRTMMHHPLHLHGHFFRVVNGQGDFAPLKHTVDVAPMTTTIIEFDANDSGDWFFHCHLLYHMHSGMARIVHYEGFTPPPEVAEIRNRLLGDSSGIFGISRLTERA